MWGDQESPSGLKAGAHYENAETRDNSVTLPVFSEVQHPAGTPPPPSEHADTPSRCL